MGRTLRRFYVARWDFCTVRYHSKVRAIPQRKKASMRELQISVLTLFRFHPNSKVRAIPQRIQRRPMRERENYPQTSLGKCHFQQRVSVV